MRIAFESESEDRALAEVAAALGPNVIGSDREMAAPRDALSEYFEGDTHELDLPVDLRLMQAPFRRSVLEELRLVPRGKTVSYGELAARAGNPKAARAVGTACARNPIPIVVPCHRVLPGTGALGNYGGGPERKRALLELEGSPRGAASPRPARTLTVIDLITTWAAGAPFGSAWIAPIFVATSMPFVTFPSSA